MEKKRNLWVIPTDKPSKLWLYKNFDYFLTGLTVEKSRDIHPQNINITSNEEIKEVKNKSWYLNIHKNDVLSIGENVVNKNNWREIILTTDQDLIKDCVQAIDDTFLEWFVKNPSCEEVEVLIEKRTWKEINWIFYYKIIIPKEEAKQELSKDEIDKFFVDMICNPKQETLEEASKRLCLNTKERVGFYKCYSWQQERSYSEAIDLFITEIKSEFKDDNWDYLEFIKERVIEQFKKK
jgi:hypothetical protein